MKLSIHKKNITVKSRLSRKYIIIESSSICSLIGLLIDNYMVSASFIATCSTW